MENIIAYLIESRLIIGVTTLSLAAVGYAFVQGPKKSTSPQVAPLPPGPPRQFLIGNLLQFPRDHFHDKFCEWHKLYGDIVYVELPRTPIVILNSYELAQQLLAIHPNTTAGRYIPYMVHDIMGWQWSLGFLQPGLHHSNQRKMLRRGIGPQVISSYDPQIERTAANLMLNLQDFEGNPHRVLLRAIGRSVNEITYGEKVLASMGEELSSWNLEALELVNGASSTFWLTYNLNSTLRPKLATWSWFPGLGIRSTLLSNQIRYTPFERAKELYEAGEVRHSIAADLLEEFGADDDVRDALGILYSSGTDTTSVSIMAFFHALFLFPEVSQKVYKEIAAVTEGTRMPRIDDRPNLPFTEATWKEAWRWNPFIPIGIPHVSSRDEILDGYLIKAGTMITPHIGSIMMDPKVWGDPDTFRPERFLAADADSLPNPHHVLFGFGVRVCPGRYLADRSGFHIAASTAALYDLAPLEGKSRPDPKSVEYVDTLLRMPVGFECRFIPRVDLSKEILKASSEA